MAVVTVPVPSDDDILGWTRESLEGSPVAARLRPLFEALNLQHLDRNDAARGARQGLGYARADFVSALLAHQAARLAALGGSVPAATAAAAALQLNLHDIVQYKADDDRWVLATITAVGALGATPVFSVRLGSASDEITGVPAGRLRARPSGGGPSLVEAEPPTYESGDLIERIADGKAGVVIEMLSPHTYRVWINGDPAPTSANCRLFRAGNSSTAAVPLDGSAQPTETGQGAEAQAQAANTAAALAALSSQPTAEAAAVLGSQPGYNPAARLLQQLGIGQHGVPGEHTRSGAHAVQDVPHPTMPSVPTGITQSGNGALAADASQSAVAHAPDYTQVWQQIIGGGPLSAAQRAVFGTLDPASLTNFSGHGALIPTLATGAADGNGASLIAPNRKIGPHEVAFVCDFVPRDGDADDVNGFTATANGITFTSGKRSPDPASLDTWMTGATRLRQWGIDNRRWPVDDGYLDVYMPRIAAFSKHYTWAAINKFDRGFRRSMHSNLLNTITSWREYPVELFQTCFVLDQAALRRHSGGAGGSTGAGGGGGSRGGAGGGKGGKGGNRHSGAGTGTSATSDTSQWAQANLKHLKVGGKDLCFGFQRDGRCRSRSITRKRHRSNDSFRGSIDALQTWGRSRDC